MAKFASLFPSPIEAEQAVEALKEARFGDEVLAQVIRKEDWKDSWGKTDQRRADPEAVEGLPPQPPEVFFDFWINEETIGLFSEGIDQGGAVLVVNVPDEMARQAQKIVKDNNGKLG